MSLRGEVIRAERRKTLLWTDVVGEGIEEKVRLRWGLKDRKYVLGGSPP